MAAAKSGTGLKKETAGALAYVLGPLTGVIFLVIEKDPFVRFHAMQSIVVFVALFVINWIPLMAIIAGPVGFILWLLLIYKAWQGEEWEVPFLGKFARQFVKKV